MNNDNVLLKDVYDEKSRKIYTKTLNLFTHSTDEPMKQNCGCNKKLQIFCNCKNGIVNIESFVINWNILGEYLNKRNEGELIEKLTQVNSKNVNSCLNGGFKDFFGQCICVNGFSGHICQRKHNYFSFYCHNIVFTYNIMLQTTVNSQTSFHMIMNSVRNIWYHYANF